MNKKTIILSIFIFIISLIVGIVIGLNIKNDKLDSKTDDDVDVQDNVNINNNGNINNNQDNGNTDNNKDNENDENRKNDIEKIIDNELRYLLSKKKLNELTNQDKLRTILILYSSENGNNDTINKNALDNVFKNSSLRNLEIVYEDIYEDSMLQDTTGKWYELDNDIYNKVILGHGGNIFNIIYKQVVDYKEESNKITISYKYAFYTTIGDGPVPINIFYNYNDAIKNENRVAVYDPMDYLTEEDFSGYQAALNDAKEYDYVKDLDKMYTYTYVFDIVNDDYVLTDYFVE